jgi:hypothetical protein
MREAGPEAWAVEEFGSAAIEDPRWHRRLVRTAARVLKQPAGRVSDVFIDAAERQGAYGLLESKTVQPAHVSQAMYEGCARRCVDEAFVFCPIDGTSLTLTDLEKRKGFGPVGSRASGGRGLKVMNAMVLSSSGVPLGISSQQWWTRPEKRRAKHRDELPPREKETQHWLDAIRQTRELIEKHAPDTRCWFQLDREGDAWPMLLEAGVGRHWFTIRSCRNRWVNLADGSRVHLDTVIAEQPVKMTYLLPVGSTATRRARTARLVVRACTVVLRLRDKQTGKHFPYEVNVVQAREHGTTPPGEKPIVWTLLTNHPITKRKDLNDIIVGYSMRWRIEELHKTWKTGACGVEQSQLRSSSAAIKWATILIAVAVRIERIKQLSRESPDRPASDEFSPIEIKAVVLLRFGKLGKAKIRRGAVPTLGDLTTWIAELGGYMGRTSSGGPPGSITIARGLKSIRSATKLLAVLASD